MKTGQAPTPETNAPQSAGSLNRAVLLLATIARGSRNGSRLTELVARTGLPRPTIHRVLNSLMALGWVERNRESGRFNLGQDLAALGYSAISRHPIERAAAAELDLLARDLRQVIYLGVRSGLDMVCIGRYESGAEIQVGRGWVGMRVPLGLTPACMGLFSCMPEDELQEVITANLSRYHRMEGFDETGFRGNVRESLARGYGVYGSILLDHTASGLGVPIRDASGYPVAGIGTTFITGWLTDAQQRERAARIQRAATRIGERINPAPDRE